LLTFTFSFVEHVFGLAVETCRFVLSGLSLNRALVTAFATRCITHAPACTVTSLTVLYCFHSLGYDHCGAVGLGHKIRERCLTETQEAEMLEHLYGECTEPRLEDT